MAPKKDYGFDEAINTFDEINNRRNKLHAYKPSTSNKVNRKYTLLNYLRIIEDGLIYMFSTPSIIKKNKGYVHDKF